MYSAEGNDGIYQVMGIVMEAKGHNLRTGKAERRYRIRWRGYAPRYDTWEPASNLLSAEEDDRDNAHYLDWKRGERPLEGKDISVPVSFPLDWQPTNRELKEKFPATQYRL